MTTVQTADLNDLRRLIRTDIRSAEAIPESEARYLVDLYYALQDYRIQAGHQVRQADAAEEPDSMLAVVFGTIRSLEDEVAWALGRFAEDSPLGSWALQMRGVGPVLTAGLMAHIDVTRAPAASSVWRFAGLDPTSVWNKGEKRPWNAKLKVLCWKLGESWKRFSGPSADLNAENALYCRLYRERKALEVQRNEDGVFAETARLSLETRNIKDPDLRKTYEAGLLPAGRLDLRATRYATKMFLSHYWQVAYELEYGTEAPNPWAIEHGGHVHRIEVPLWPI